MLKGFRVRLLPTAEQHELMWKHVNAARFVYNWGLELRKKTYEESGKTMNYVEQSRELTKFKRTPEAADRLTGVNASVLQRSLRDLETAYINFFRSKKGFPKFKCFSKSKKAFGVQNSKTYFNSENVVTLPTIGRVRYRSNYNLPKGRLATKMLNPRVALTNGKWMLSFSLEVADLEKKPELNDFSCGVDLGIKTLVTVSFGGSEMKISNPNKGLVIRRHMRQLKRSQRKLSRSKKGSQRRLKARQRLGKKWERIRNIRRNHAHQSTRRVVNLLPRRIVLEDLNVKGMMKNHHLARAVSECNFAELHRQLEYKARAMGIEVVYADRFFPSSKTCSCCGGFKPGLKLSDREFHCPRCGAVLDRDFNAARNLELYAPTKDSLVLK